MATDTDTGNKTTLQPQQGSSSSARARSIAGESRPTFTAGPELEVCVIGLGYIGLPTASLLGTMGCQVHGVDVNPEVVDTINGGRIHIVEPDLDLLVRQVVQGGQLKASTEPKPADVFVIAVPTPLTPDHEPDLSMVRSATQSILPVVRKGNLVILESTSPPGTTEKVVAAELERAGFLVGVDVFVAYCPERVLPGSILTELVENARVVGGVDDASTEAVTGFYKSFVRGEVVPTNARTAEIVKLSENSYRDVNIAFANELSMLSASQGVSVWEVIRIANRHPRVNILQPGPGVGGHCIAVDPWFLAAADSERTPLIQTARTVNDSKPGWVVERVRACAERVKEPVIACLGLSYKADVDDLRESPAVEIVRQLQREDLGELIIVEPNLLEHPEFDLATLEDAVARANIVLVLVDHRQFMRLRGDVLHEKLLIDTRGLYL